MVCPQFRPLVGGYERAAERLSLALCERGHHVVVVTERRSTNWLARENLNGVLVRRLWTVHRPRWHTLSSLISLAWFLLCHGRSFDVLHLHQHGTPAALCVALRPVLRRPIVLKLPVTGPDGIVNVLRGGWFPRLMARLHQRVDACIATSERGANEALEIGIPAARVHRIPNGIDTDWFRPAEVEKKSRLCEQLGIGARRVVLSMGRLSAQKNPFLLLEAWRSAEGVHASSLLVFAGDGPYQGELRERVSRSGLTESVRVLGRIDAPLHWYQAADVFVLSSDYEGLSNSLLEALSCGLPAISTCVSGSEDIFRDADVGELVPVGNAQELTRALVKLLDDPKRRAMCSTTARCLALSRFSLRSVVEEITRLYSGIVRGAEL